MIPRGSVWLTQVAVVLAPLNVSWKSRVLLGLMAFVGVAMLVGSIFLMATGYPKFLGTGSQPEPISSSRSHFSFLRGEPGIVFHFQSRAG